jgi:type II restriction enzyme
MKQLVHILGLRDEEELFGFILEGFRNTLTTFDYFVDWKKVFNNVNPVKRELNLLNTLVGAENIDQECADLIREYPNVINAFPILIASRERSFEVLVDVKNFLAKHYDFSISKPTDEQIKDLITFVYKSGLSDVLKNRQVKNLVDYVVGIEVGLDSNGRKNRGGKLMEDIVELFVEECCRSGKMEYIAQATAHKIKEKWELPVEMDKSSRIIDFVINKGGKLYFIEVNFYNGSGSKLKSTATEYCEMYERYRRQSVTFIWVTDGIGWRSTAKPLREYFDKSDYLLNLKMLREGVLDRILLN